MIDPKELNQKVDTLSELLRSKLSVRGRTLEARLSQAGRTLPKRLHRAGQTIVDAQKKAAHPRLALTVDPDPVKAAYQEITAHLKTIDPADRRKGKLLNWLGGQVFNLMVIIALLVILLRWQGMI
ncbi:hypothetical protein [Roseovarius sp. 2305UL8-3]|uniref:hypothetical protein n=1 Tax=Roseovarius conchicola TaxID=3121636 RepID=UPI003529501D